MVPERDFPDGRMQKLMGKSWNSWNLPEQPTDLDLRKLREAYLPPDQYRVHHQSTPLPPRYISLFGTHPDSDFLSITKCPACGWLMKVQHANKHFLRDSRGAIVCKESDLALFGPKVLGKACHPVGDLKDTYSKKITLRLFPSPHKSSIHSLRGSSSINDVLSKSRSGSGSHTTNKTDYYSHSSSQYRSRSSHSQMHVPSSSYMQKGRSGSSTSSSTHSLNSSSNISKTKTGKSHTSTSSSTSSWSSLRSPPPPPPPLKSSSSHKPQSTSGSYTLSIPSEDMGQNESVEDLLMSNISHSHGSSKHTVHIIATSNSANKSKVADPDYDRIKFYSDVPEKRLKLDSHSRNNDHHKTSTDMNDLYSKTKQKLNHSSSSYNGATSSHLSSSDSSKKSKSSSLSLSKNDSGSSNKHHLRSTASSTLVTVSKPVVSVSNLSSSGQSRSHSLGTIGSSSSIAEKEKDKERTTSQKKKKRKRDKDEPRKIIPLKDRDFNPDKHCGVCSQGSNVPCKRSLTCKTHSVALRRAVVGRSQSFDALLAAHKLAKSEEKGFTQKPKEEPKEEVVIEDVPQVTPPKPKKKKISGSSSTIGASPNDLRPLAGVLEPTSYDRSGSPDIEVIEVKAKPKPLITAMELAYANKKYKACPLVYPYTPNTQSRFEMVWYDPSIMEGVMPITAEEKKKFKFLLKHYKNPHFLNTDVSPPLAKNVREKRNVFSNWNASEKPVEGSQHTVSWTLDNRRSNADIDDELQCVAVLAKK